MQDDNNLQNDPFFSKWFKGVQNFLKDSTDEEARKFLSYCAEGCSKSYSLAVYQNAFIKGNSLEESLSILANAFDDFAYTIHTDHIEIRYSSCGCDLYSGELIRSKRLCDCSELSLAYNWGSIFGPKNVEVQCKESLIRGGKHCLFEVRVAQLGHSLTRNTH